MSDRTPETDAFIERNIGHGPTGWEWRVHSRRLERERDEAREQLADWENAAAHFEADRAALHDLVRQAGEEYFRKWPADKDRIGQRLAFQDAVMQEIDLRTLDFERMKQERDDAREAGWKAAMQAVWQRLPSPDFASEPMTPREVAKLIEFVRREKEGAK